MGALVLSLLIAQPLALEKLSAAQATSYFARSHLEGSPSRDQYSIVNEPVTILIAEASGTDQAAIKALPRILDPSAPRPPGKGWEPMLWNYVHAGATGDPTIKERKVTLDGRAVAAAEFTVAIKARRLYSGLLLTQLLPGARVRVVIGIREGDSKDWLTEVGPPAAFVLTEGAAWFSPSPVLFGKTLKIPPGCAVEPTVAASKRVTITCESKATLTWAPLPKEPDLKEYRRSLEEGARGSPCEISFKEPACTVAGLPAQCLLAECKSQPQASSLTAKLDFEQRHYLVACSNAPKGCVADPVSNGLFVLGK